MVPQVIKAIKIAFNNTKKDEVILSVLFHETKATPLPNLLSTEINVGIKPYKPDPRKLYSTFFAALAAAKLRAQPSASHADILDNVIRSNPDFVGRFTRQGLDTVAISIPADTFVYKGEIVYINSSKVEVGMAQFMNAFPKQAKSVEMEVEWEEASVETIPIIVSVTPPPPVKSGMIKKVEALEKRLEQRYGKDSLVKLSERRFVRIDGDLWPYAQIKDGKIYGINTHPEGRSTAIDYNIVDFNGDGEPDQPQRN